ncbi:MAG: PIN domain-containing protein [Aquabacterium sp.]
MPALALTTQTTLPDTADAGPSSVPIVILDTNALLDWRVFKDPAAHPVAQALNEGRLRWLACPSMEQEWHQVWPRSAFARWQPDPDADHPRLPACRDGGRAAARAVALQGSG